MITIINATDFRASQGLWLNRLAAGEKIIVRSRGREDMQLTAKPVKAKKAKAAKPKRDIYAEFRGALQDWKDYLAGDETKMHPIEEFMKEIDSPEMPEELKDAENDPLKALDYLGKLISNTGKSPEQLIGDYLEEKYAFQ